MNSSSPIADSPNPYLSIIIPAFNEQNRIADTLYEVKDFVASQKYTSEIIVVDDGSQDLTGEIVKFIDIYGFEMENQQSSLLVENLENNGKGFAVAKGILKSRGDIVIFLDADSATPISEIDKLIPYFSQGYDIVVGSRHKSNSIVEQKSLARKIVSKTFNVLVQSLVVKGIHDTQCGFKAYSSAAATNIANRQKCYGFAFDIEHLYIANKLGYQIKEVGINWTHQDGSKVSLHRDAIRMLFDIIKIKMSHRSEIFKA